MLTYEQYAEWIIRHAESLDRMRTKALEDGLLSAVVILEDRIMEHDELVASPLNAFRSYRLTHEFA